MLPALHDSIHLLICPSAICIQKGHVSVPAVSSVVSIIEKSDRNCPERAECTSVRISLMGLLYRNYLEKSTMILNGITFYVRSLHAPCTTFSRPAFFIK